MWISSVVTKVVTYLVDKLLFTALSIHDHFKY